MTINPNADAFLATAAVETRRWIAADRENAQPPVDGMLDFIQAHLFDQGMSATRVYEACGLPRGLGAADFYLHTGTMTRAYIEARRIQTSSHLLLDTDLCIWEVAALVGYSQTRVFSKAFQRLMEMNPSEYRITPEKAPDPDALP